jgi:hypothetical protein
MDDSAEPNVHTASVDPACLGMWPFHFILVRFLWAATREGGEGHSVI